MFSPLSLIIGLNPNRGPTFVLCSHGYSGFVANPITCQVKCMWKCHPMRGTHCFYQLNEICGQILTQNCCCSSETLIRRQPRWWVAGQALIINLVHWCQTLKWLHQRVLEKEWQWKRGRDGDSSRKKERDVISQLIHILILCTSTMYLAGDNNIVNKYCFE